MSVNTLEKMDTATLSAVIEKVTREVMTRVVTVPQSNGHSASAAGVTEPPTPEFRPASFEVPMGISNRHLHLCREDLDKLFGEGYELRPLKELYQKGYYAAYETVMVVGKRRALPDVRILGPLRPKSQVELSLTDAISLGLQLNVAESGVEPVSQPVLLVGPKGQTYLPGGAGGGAFIARRHMHMDPAEAARYGLKEGSLVKVRTPGERSITLHDVLVRMKAGWSTELHLDTDEANAAGLKNGQMVTVLLPQTDVCPVRR